MEDMERNTSKITQELLIQMESPAGASWRKRGRSPRSSWWSSLPPSQACTPWLVFVEMTRVGRTA
jgi:hypothetical protein